MTDEELILSIVAAIGFIIGAVISQMFKSKRTRQLAQELQTLTSEHSQQQTQIATLRDEKRRLDQDAQRLQGELNEANETAAARSRELDAFSNLLIAADVGLVVVDARDHIKSTSSAASSQAFKRGTAFSEYVFDDDRGYREQQENNRADGVAKYGIRRAQDRAHLIVRSAPVQHALSTLGAASGDRLILCAPLTKPDTVPLELEERVKLGSLLTHGIARQAALVWKYKELEPEWRENLMGLLYRRLGVISELLAKWEYPAAGARLPEIEVSLATIADLLKTLSWLGHFVSNDDDVRRELRWQDGMLSRPWGSSPLNYSTSDWPNAAVLTALKDGAELFIIEELIINAYRHGVPGKAATFKVRKSSIPGFLELVVSNAIAPSAQARAPRPYGGRTLISEACRQSAWHLEDATIEKGTYQVCIRVPCKS